MERDAEVSKLLEEKLARIQDKFEAEAEARKLQAEEYERRLTELSHAHQHATEIQHTYLPRENFEQFVRELLDWRRQVDLRYSTLLLEIQKSFTLQEVFDTHKEQDDKSHDNLELWRRGVDQELNIQRGRMGGRAAVLAGIVAVLSLLFSLVALWIRVNGHS
jgi:hypothetical protein